MSFPLARAAIAESFIAACRAELHALKPGNVHVHAAGHGMEIDHFERAAVAAAPFIADPALSTGARILGAVRASFAVTGLNTNLGIVLLCAPLAAAADLPEGAPPLRDRLATVLDRLDRNDADQAFQAIVIANPAGLGRTESGDVAGPATITLKEAMALAAEKDRIARAYNTGFSDIFDFGLPQLCAGQAATGDGNLAITALHMAFLSAFPDSHIARKHGLPVAEQVQQQAQRCKPIRHFSPHAEAWEALMALDRSLKARGLNPGTTADFVVATLFTHRLINQSATTGHS
jgi:triphosphoribosyl-dephospho-CoA synthase